MKGIIVKYNAAKGFGFIHSEQYEKDLFVDINNVVNASGISIGQPVEFEVKNTKKGIAAVSVVSAQKQLSPFLLFGYIAVFITIIITGYLYLYQEMHPFLAYVLAVNITILTMYVWLRKCNCRF